MTRLTPLLLTLSLSLTACAAPIHVGGEYHPVSPPRLRGEGTPDKLVDESRFVFLYGFVDPSGPADVQDRINRKLSGNPTVVDLTVEDSTTVLGYVLSFFTVGIVSERHTMAQAHILPPKTAPSAP